MKLIYFDLRGRAEAARFILAYAGVEYEDKRYSFAEWGAVKNGFRWGQLPALELDDGTMLYQSVAIARFLARKYNLVGSTELEAAQCDEMVDAYGDLINDWVDYKFKEQNEDLKAEKKKKFVEVNVPAFFSKLNSIIKENGGTHVVGKGLTWADILITASLESFENDAGADLLQAYPEVLRMRNAVVTHPKIKAWIDKRPKQ